MVPKVLPLIPKGDSVSRFGKYQVLSKLAQGGMAELFLVRATGIEGFEKVVVVKRILPQYLENDEFTGMFLDEARLAATLQHPNIAQVYDIGFDGESFFFAMEYVHGRDLRQVIKASRRQSREIPLEHALHVVLGTCAGLHHAHEKLGPDGRPLGIVHRDVSPSNVLLTFDGGVKVVDFGIAKARLRQTHTKVGTLKGKIAYMSPEQVKGDPVDRRSDVFAIGIILYELTTGTRLFHTDDEISTLHKIATQDAPPPSARKRNYPPRLEAIVMKALDRDVDKRHATAQELQLELEQVARDERLAISPVRAAQFLKELFPGEEAPSAQGGRIPKGKLPQGNLIVPCELPLRVDRTRSFPGMDSIGKGLASPSVATDSPTNPLAARGIRETMLQRLAQLGSGPRWGAWLLLAGGLVLGIWVLGKSITPSPAPVPRVAPRAAPPDLTLTPPRVPNLASLETPILPQVPPLRGEQGEGATPIAPSAVEKPRVEKANMSPSLQASARPGHEAKPKKVAAPRAQEERTLDEWDPDAPLPPKRR
ncbi:MAG: protein kinase [Deltaproteobacteria bacterium]|nr:protein kinase [Deltaproteobacteria bacterium]